MRLNDRVRKILEAAKKLGDKRHPRSREGIRPPNPSPSVVTHTGAEEILRREQHEITSIIDDAMALLAAGRFSEKSKAAFRERMEKLSPSGRLTAKVLVKARIDSRQG